MSTQVVLNTNVLRYGEAGQTVAVPDDVGAQLLDRGKARLAPGEKMPGGQSTPPAVVDWPQLVGPSASSGEVVEIAEANEISAIWLEAAIKRIEGAGLEASVEVLERIATNARLKRDVLALADAYVLAAVEGDFQRAQDDDADGKGRIQRQEAQHDEDQE